MDLRVITKKYQALKLVLTLVLACAFIFLIGGMSGFGKVKATAQTVTIRSAGDLTAYSNAYKNDTSYTGSDSITITPAADDIIVISINSGDFVSDDTFVNSIGKSGKEFSGILVIPSAGKDTFDLTNIPLFDYVTTDFSVKIGSPSGSAGTVKIRRHGSSAGGALFANHVTKGTTNNASWRILLDGASDATGTYTGLIGDIADECVVEVIYTSNKKINISSTGNVGYICGTLGEDASLAVTTAGSANQQLTITSSGGHAGGLVGEMESGSTLTIKSQNNGRFKSVTTTGSEKYAGGIVGKVDDVTATTNGVLISESDITNYLVNCAVTGTAGAGGLFGYYKNSAESATFTMLNTFAIQRGMKIKSTTSSGSAGGIFGVLENTDASFTFNGDKTNKIINVELQDSNNSKSYGGVCGLYQTYELSNTFTITNTSVQLKALTGSDGKGGAPNANSGGLVGYVSYASYIAISEVQCESLGTNNGSCPGGGLIGSIGDAGSFIDVSGNVKVVSRFYAGLIEYMGEGVLRIQGTTDLTGLSRHNLGGDYTTGTIVRRRNRALIYALGTGSNYTKIENVESGWTLKRYTGPRQDKEIAGNNIDDIVSWGQVIRVNGSTFNENQVFTVNMTDHTVTLLGATATIANVNQFAITALNIKLNTGDPAVGGALQFAAGEANTSSYLLSHTITLSSDGDDIDLTNTGITGLTRDNDFKIGDTTYPTGSFTGTLEGNNKTITFATGEVYGVDSNGTPLSYLNGAGKLDSIEGTIRRHLLNGLFARTGSSAVIQNLKIAGNFYVTDDQKGYNMCIGGIVAEASGTLTLTNITVTAMTVSIIINGGTATSGTNFTRAYIGGAVGVAKGNNANITVTNGSYGPTIIDLSYQSQGFQYVGGVIGLIETGNSQTVSISNCSVGLVYTKAIRDKTEEPECLYLNVIVDGKYNDNKNRESCFGAAIGGMLNQNYSKNNRKITLSNVSVNITASGIAANGRFGGILGTDWLSADVTLTGITISSASITALNTVGDKFFGGLVHTATGHWVVNSISITSASFSIPTSSYFGFIANKTFSTNLNKNTALYLEVGTTSTNYNIGALTFTDSPTFTVYDEIVASSIATGADVTCNGNSVISIITEGNVINNATKTYRNKTSYGTTNHSINPNTRYYYNIGDAITNVGTAKYKFLVFTVRQYAHSSILTFFSNNTSFSGTLDMTGLSYYPVDLTTNITFDNNTTLKLDNNLMEGYVNHADDSETTRSTRTSDNQHYLMHTAAFRNVSANITVSNGKTLTIQGNVPKLSDSYCGFLIAGTLNGTSQTPPKKTQFTANKIVFDGAFITNNGAQLTTNIYAPLLINKASKNTSITISEARQSTSAYSTYAASGYYAASSLIGDVGNEEATAMVLTFTNLVFDGRSTVITGDGVAAMNTVYGTTKSIFSRATILNSFTCADYNEGSAGTYYFGLGEDWKSTVTPPHPDNPSTAKHLVTYGKEITDSVEFLGRQKKYNNSKYYTAYSATPTTSSGDSFSSGFLNYVYSTSETNQHELMVNTSYDYEIEGCGKYDDPYIINDYDALDFIAKMLNRSTLITTASTIYLPSDITSYDYTSTSYTKYKYNFNTSGFTSAGQTTRDYDVVREYIAGAYYKITAPTLEIPMGFVALGTPITDDTNMAKYAFRGVILGENLKENDEDPDLFPVITNKTNAPLIRSSNGCVVKDLTIKVGEYNDANHDLLNLSFQSSYSSFEYDITNSHTAYGAVIGQIMGGDTIIDNVNVEFDEDVRIVLSDAGTTNSRLIPVGGYVGVIVNGGLIFRNMTGTYDGLTNAICNKINDAGYIYVNPIIGRVIAGYAFNETASTYNVTSTKLSNGTKNYTVPDLSLAATKLGVSNTYAVTVPNGQALYVLGAIVNSGAASASDYNAQYNALSACWSAYRQYTTVRGSSGYSTVGTSSDADYTSACDDSYAVTASLEQIPYIVRAYTTPVDTSKYYARALANSGTVSISVTGALTGANAVAAGFRGIGSIYLDNDLVRLRISSFTGGSYTVALNMRYVEYDSPSEYYKAANQNTAGFGLFNILQIYQADSASSIYNLTLSGSIFYDVINSSNGSSSLYKYESTDADGLDYASVLSVGGVAGYAGSATNYDKFYIKNVTLDSLSVEGAKYAGGLIGHSGSSTAVSTIANCGTDASTGITVIAGGSAGGFVGYLRSYVTIDGDISDSGTKSTLLVNRIETKGQNTSDSRIFHSAGGIVGYVQPQGTTVSTIQNYIVKGKSGNLKHIFSTSTSAGENTNAGGVVGSVYNQRLTITDVDVRDVNICAAYAGGIIGRTFSNTAIGNANEHIVNISNITIDGDVGSSGANSNITGYLTAGGIIANMDNTGSSGGGTIIFENGEIKNYNISSSTGTSANHTAGGFMGYSNPGGGATLTVKIHNFLIDGCAISNLATGPDTANGTGGLFGVVRRSNVEGYNILIDETSVTSSTADARTSAVIGNYFKSSSAIKLVGVSVNLTGATTANTKARATGKSSGEADVLEDYNSNDYIVFADYKNTSSGISPNTTVAGIDDGSTNDDNYTDVTSASPYVTVNPKITIGSTVVTSDGVASSVSNLPYTQIKTDGASEKYKYSVSSYLSTFGTYDSLLHMFSSEAPSFTGTDFPVLVLEDETRATSHEMINSYLCLLTNTTINFGNSTDTRFSVVIYNMTFNGTSFDVSASGASLKLSSGAGGQFYMENTDVDSGESTPQFSLIDVRFKDPSSSEIAYHLYVPVFVKKVLSYQFDIAVKSGTTYIENNYSSSYGLALIENVGTPVTIYFKYTYSRNSNDWTAAILASENVNQNYTKTLRFTKANENVVVKNYPNDTILVLVDKQTGTPYYSTWGAAFSDGTLNLSAFRAVMGLDGEGNPTFSGASFTPQPLGGLLKLSATVGGDFVQCAANDPNLKFIASDGNGYRLATNEDEALTKYAILPNMVEDANGTYVSCSEGESTLTDGTNFYREATGPELADGSVTKYSDTLTESYYISIFTDVSENFHYYIVSTPSELTGSGTTTKIKDQGAHTMCHLTMGKIFDHDNFSITSVSSPSGGELMTDENNVLQVSVAAQMGLSDSLGDLKGEVGTAVGGTSVYQSFLVYLNRKEGIEQLRAILGNPTISGTWGIDVNLNDGIRAAEITAYGEGDKHLTQNYAEFVTTDLHTQFATGNKFGINATLTFTYSAAAIPTQFPGEYNDNGVTVSGASNISFSQSTTSNSKNTVTGNESPVKRYHSAAKPEVATLDLFPIDGAGKFDFTHLGINANYLDATNINTQVIEGVTYAVSANFDLLATLNTEQVRDQIESYTSAAVTITLAQKQADGTYGSDLDVSDYITAMKVGNTNATDDGDSFYAEILRASLTDDGSTITLPVLHFTVKTGKALETAGLTYGNYRITVSVALHNGASPIGASSAANYVVYTNSKVISEFITPPSP